MKAISPLWGTAMALALCLGSMATQADATTVTIPDLTPNSYVNYGTGDASVTYSGVTFTQSAALGDATLYNIGSNFFGGPVAVLSSQRVTSGVENILIDLPKATTNFSVGYGTFNGSDVTFKLSNGDSFTQGSVAAGDYTITNTFSVSSTPFNSVLVTSPDYVLNINTIQFGAIPEPATWAMMLVGLSGLGATMRMPRRKNGAALAAD